MPSPSVRFIKLGKQRASSYLTGENAGNGWGWGREERSRMCKEEEKGCTGEE